MNKRIKNRLVASVISLALIITSSGVSFAANEGSPPAETSSSAVQASAVDAVLITPENNDANPSPSGYVSRGVDFSKINDYSYGAKKGSKLRALTALPSSYDYRTENPSKLTTVRNQGSYGTCWAFAALASASGSLSVSGQTGPAEQLSPKQLAYATFNERTFYPYWYAGQYSVMQGGGDSLIAAAAMGKGFGPVTEAHAPYIETGGTAYYTPDPVSSQNISQPSYYMASDYHLKEMLEFPAPYTSSNAYSADNVATLKQALIDNGPLATAYRSIGQGSAVYRYTDFFLDPDHAVTIVGYDDSVSKTNFSPQPAGDGAWLIQNSWGTGSGNGGYFWLSYYDKTMAESYSFSLDSKTSYDGVDYYDDLGYTGDRVSLSPQNALYVANVFSAGGTHKAKQLAGVSFYTTEPGVSYEISAYSNPSSADPTGGTKLDIAPGEPTSISGSAQFAGLHTVYLANGVPIWGAGTYSIVLKTSKTDGGKMEDIPIEGIVSNGDYITIEYGQSFIKMGSAWRDLKRDLYDKDSEWEGSGNVTVKALYKDSDIDNGWQRDSATDNKYYYLDGAAQTGIQTIDGKKYYFNTSTGVMLTGIQTINGKKYGFAASGVMLTGIQTVSGKKYYFSASGVMQTGWKTVAGKRYFFNSDGTMYFGWKTLSGKKLYLSKGNGGSIAIGWTKIKHANGKTYNYYFGTDGKMKTKWQSIRHPDGKVYRYYFGGTNDGRMRTGWQKISGKRYYFGSANDGKMSTGWRTISGKRYYFGGAKDGKMRTGWQKIAGKVYYFNPNGTLRR